MQLELNNIHHAYNHQPVVTDFSLQLARGQIGCLLGPSGCGKTTVLRLIAGFENVLEGEIKINGITVSRKGCALPPEKRHVGMVFQDYALFPHLTLAGNVGFGLHHLPARDRNKRVDHLLEVVGLSTDCKKYPHELSGGQQQRVALARALAPQPELLLLDEPFSSLDVDLRERLSQDVREILKNQNATAILVTHDQHEAFAMADEIGVMHQGKLQQWDSAYNIYHRPANRFIADFVGQGVLLPGTVLNVREVKTTLGVLPCQVPEGCIAGSPVDILLRPDDIVYDDSGPLFAEVLHKAFRGADILYTLGLDGGARVLSLVPSHHNHALGEKIGIRLDIDHVVAFSRR